MQSYLHLCHSYDGLYYSYFSVTYETCDEVLRYYPTNA